MSATRQWVIAVLAILEAFFVAGILGGFAAGRLGFWHLPGSGFCAALAVVLSTYFAVPSHKFLMALCALGVGALVAWPLLEPSSYPESYGAQAYQQTHLPVISTYIGGAIGLLVAGVLRLWSGPNNSFKPRPLRGPA